MKAQVESISPVKARLSVEVSAEEIAREENSALQALRRRVTVPGFRKGKAPLEALRRAYGARVREDALSEAVRRSYAQALTDHAIVPVDDPEIELQPAAEGAGVAYTAVVEVRPRVEAHAYQGLRFQKEAIEVAEADVEARLETLRREHASLEPAPEDHRAQDGDLVVVDYEGRIDGVAFDGGRGEDRPVMLGAGMFIPGFEEGLLDAAAGEERSIEAEFPADYRVTELAGRRAEFSVRVKEVKVRRLPDLDDDFAREAAQAESLAELRERVRGGLEAETRGRVDREFRERVVDGLLRVHPFEVPESLVRRQMAHALENLRKEVAQRGMDPERLDWAQIQENYRRGSERAVRWAFLLDAISRAEGLAVGDDEVEQRLRAIAEADGRPYALVRSFFEKDDRLDSLRSSIHEGKVVDRVVELGTVETVGRQELPPAGGAA